MRTLVAYYSKTGRTAALAQILQREIVSHGDTAEILQVHRKEEASFLQSATEARRHVCVDLQERSIDVSHYDLVLIGFPIWGGAAASPINSLVAALIGVTGKRFALFASYGGLPNAPSHALNQVTDGISRLGCQVVAAQGFSNLRRATVSDDASRFLAAVTTAIVEAA